MKILIDECAPKALKKLLMNHGHECFTVQEMGWSGKQNGELLNLVETAFDMLVRSGHKSSLATKPSGPQNRDRGSLFKPGQLVQVGGST
jgi:Domain of unknown function (DUF5615)